MKAEITITAAADKYKIPVGRLYSLAQLERFDDPLIVDKTDTGEPVLLDDWRLKRLANQSGEGSRE